MKLKVALIRHGCDCGGRICGTTDCAMTDADINRIRGKMDKDEYPEAELVFSSDASRCWSTANLIFPNVPTVVEKENKLRAPDFGSFDGKSAKELLADESFVQWASVTETLPYKGGESPYAVSARAVSAFQDIASEMAGKGLKHAAIISHKMIIVAILRRFQIPRSSYMHWDVPYGGGYLLLYNTLTRQAEVLRKI